MTKKLSESGFEFVREVVGEKRFSLITNAISVLNDAIDSGEILNPKYKETKDAVNRILEDVFSKLINERYFHAGKYESLPAQLQDIGYYFPQMHTVDSKLKKLDGLSKSISHPVIDDARHVLSAFKPIADALVDIKPLIVKSRRNGESESESAYTPPRVVGKDVQKVIDVLCGITDRLCEAAKNELYSDMKSYVDMFFFMDDRSMQNVRNVFGRDVFAAHVISAVSEKKSYNPRSNIELRDDWSEVLMRMASEQVEAMRAKYISKNTRKLSSIISSKGNLESVDVLNETVRRGAINGVMHIKFSDGSSFVVENSTVLSYSSAGKPFYRFPTTFHNVILPSGEKMSNPSEQRVNEIFCSNNPAGSSHGR